MCNSYISILIYHLPITQQKCNAPRNVTNLNSARADQVEKPAVSSLLPPDWLVPRTHPAGGGVKHLQGSAGFQKEKGVNLVCEIQ